MHTSIFLFMEKTAERHSEKNTTGEAGHDVIRYYHTPEYTLSVDDRFLVVISASGFLELRLGTFTNSGDASFAR